MAFEAVRLAIKYMTPVMLLSDSFLANSAEPWRIVDPDELPDLRRDETPGAEDFAPYRRDPETLVAALGCSGNAGTGAPHRRPGKGRRHGSGQLRRGQPSADGLACGPRRSRASPATFPRRRSSGPAEGDLLVVGWGSTYGAIAAAVDEVQQAGRHVSPTCTCAT